MSKYPCKCVNLLEFKNELETKRVLVTRVFLVATIAASEENAAGSFFIAPKQQKNVFYELFISLGNCCTFELMASEIHIASVTHIFLC